MKTPSIEARLSRMRQSEDTHPIARHLETLPIIGKVARVWIRPTRSRHPEGLWAPLPPITA